MLKAKGESDSGIFVQIHMVTVKITLTCKLQDFSQGVSTYSRQMAKMGDRRRSRDEKITGDWSERDRQYGWDVYKYLQFIANCYLVYSRCHSITDCL